VIGWYKIGIVGIIVAVGVTVAISIVDRKVSDEELIGAAVNHEMFEQKGEPNEWLNSVGVVTEEDFFAEFPECCLITGGPEEGGIFGSIRRNRYEVVLEFGDFFVFYLVSPSGEIVKRFDWR
jgi:hypothetical protein